MLSLINILSQCQYYNKIDEEYCNIKNAEIINEGFKASILNKLAKTISDVQSYQKEINNKYKIRTFASIFGPVKSRGGNIISGVKWSEITDSDVKKYNGNDNELIKLVKQLYAKKIKGVLIICDKTTEDILYFIQGNNYISKSYQMTQDKPIVYEFVPDYKNSLKTKTVTLANGYSTRNLKLNEIINLLSDNDVYFIEITEDMVQSFKTTVQDRTELKKGIIYYDENSLKEYKKKQKARYDTIVKEMKAKKLIENRKKLFDDLKKANDEIIAIYEKVISNPEYIERSYDLSRLMDNISRAYDNYYKYIKNEHQFNMDIKQMQDSGVPEEKINKYKDFSLYKHQYETSIRSCEEYLNSVKEDLKKLKNELK